MARKQKIKDIDEITDVNQSTEVIAPAEEVVVEEVVVDNAPKFKKSQLMASERYRNHVHLLDVYLKDGETYNLKTVDKLVRDLTKR